MNKALLSLTNFYKKYKFQILLVIGLRIAFSLWLALIWIVIDKFIPTSEGVLWETYYNLERSSSILGRAFIDVWLRWDAVHYMNIAEFGYKGVGVSDTVFFPLYPYLVGYISKITTLNVTLIGIIVSSIATIFTSIFLFDLVIDLFHDHELALLSSIILLFYPFAFFFHAPYTDALFLSLSIGSILMMNKKKPIAAGMFAFLAGLTRAQGILLILPMMIYYFQDHWKEKTFLNWREFFSLFMSPLGFGIYSFWRKQSGMLSLLSSYQNHSGTIFRFPIENILFAFQEFIQSPTILEFSEILSVIFFLTIIIWMLFHPTFQKHFPIMIYTVAVWLLITSKTVVFASPLQSANRYVLHIFFVFVGFAYLINKLSPLKQKLLFFLSLAAMMTLSGLYALWIFVG